MATYNLSEMTGVKFDDVDLTEVWFNGVLVWTSLQSVSISGVAEEGQILTANVNPSSAPITSYQWFRGTTAINGATSNTYKVVNADRGYTLMCRAYIGNTFKQSPNTATVKGWRTITQPTGLGDETPILFSVPVRNPQVYAKVVVSGRNKGGTIQAGSRVWVGETEVGLGYENLYLNGYNWKVIYENTVPINDRTTQGYSIKADAFDADWDGAVSTLDSFILVLNSWEQFD